jgi:glucose-1-phosphate thymidylyltransferase
MKGIVLAGGIGSRLWPITRGLSKQLLPIYDKPLVHYPIATLMTAGVREILIISTPQHIDSYQTLLNDGTALGIKFDFAVQLEPGGLAQALLIAEAWLAGDSVCLILGDNIFHGSGLGRRLSDFSHVDGAQIFAYRVTDPDRYGVVEFDSSGSVISLEEKPSIPKSRYAVPGLYFYDNNAVNMVKTMLPSERGELEITTLNNLYLSEGKLRVEVLPRGTAWLDTGTFESLHDASTYIRIIEDRQGMKVSCLEEIAWRMGWVSTDEILTTAATYKDAPYGKYLKLIVRESSFDRE